MKLKNYTIENTAHFNHFFIINMNFNDEIYIILMKYSVLLPLMGNIMNCLLSIVM